MVVSTAGVLVDLYGRHGTKWVRGAQSASGGSRGGLITAVTFLHQVGEGVKWDERTAGSKYQMGGGCQVVKQIPGT